MIGTEGARLLLSSGTDETPQARAPRRLIARPTESEHPGVEINAFSFFSNYLSVGLLYLLIKGVFYQKME